MSIKLLLVVKFKTNTQKIDITEMVTDITWSGDEESLPRKLDFSLNISKEIGDKPSVNVPTGSMIIFYNEGKELFRGFVFKVGTDTNGVQSVNCYDPLIYFAKNSHSILVKNKTASEVITSLAKKFGLKVGTIHNTVFKVKRKIFSNVSLAEISTTMLSETSRNTKKKYKIISKKGKIELIQRAKALETVLVVDNVISANKEVSIENLYTQVLVTKGSLENDKDAAKFKTYTAKDSSGIAKYGVLQKVEEADDKASYDSMRKLASSVLAQSNKPEVTVDFEFIGVDTVVTGTKIRLINEALGINQSFYVSSDSHSWTNGVHKMSLQLSGGLE